MYVCVAVRIGWEDIMVFGGKRIDRLTSILWYYMARAVFVGSKWIHEEIKQ